MKILKEVWRQTTMFSDELLFTIEYHNKSGWIAIAVVLSMIWWW